MGDVETFDQEGLDLQTKQVFQEMERFGVVFVLQPFFNILRRVFRAIRRIR